MGQVNYRALVAGQPKEFSFRTNWIRDDPLANPNPSIDT
jgi:hypothetical protein